MLVLTRKSGQSVIINDEIKIMVVQVKGKQVRIGIEAPASSKIFREEIYNKPPKRPATKENSPPEVETEPLVAKPEEE